MNKIVFTLGTVVEVLAHSALVAEALDLSLAAAVALDTYVYHGLHLGLLKLLFWSLLSIELVQELVEDSRDGRLELSSDKVLDCLAGHVGSIYFAGGSSGSKMTIGGGSLGSGL